MHVPLASEFDYYIRNREKLCGEHEGEYVVIKGGTVLDFFPDQAAAIRETARTHELGTFLVQKCDPDPKSTVFTHGSRYRFE